MLVFWYTGTYESMKLKILWLFAPPPSPLFKLFFSHGFAHQVAATALSRTELPVFPSAMQTRPLLT